jgi:hypothetical protein
MPCVDGFTTGSEIARSKLRSGTSAMRCHCDDWSLLRPSFSSVGEKTVESSERFSEGGSGTRVGIARAPRAVCRRLPDGGKRHSRLEPFCASHDRQQAANFCLSTLHVERPESVQHLPLDALLGSFESGSDRWRRFCTLAHQQCCAPVSNRVSGWTPRVAPVYRTSFCFAFPCAAFSVRITDVTISHVIVNSSARARRTQFWLDQSLSAS